MKRIGRRSGLVPVGLVLALVAGFMTASPAYAEGEGDTTDGAPPFAGQHQCGAMVGGTMAGPTPGGAYQAFGVGMDISPGLGPNGEPAPVTIRVRNVFPVPLDAYPAITQIESSEANQTFNLGGLRPGEAKNVTTIPSPSGARVNIRIAAPGGASSVESLLVIEAWGAYCPQPGGYDYTALQEGLVGTQDHPKIPPAGQWTIDSARRMSDSNALAKVWTAITRNSTLTGKPADCAVAPWVSCIKSAADWSSRIREEGVRLTTQIELARVATQCNFAELAGSDCDSRQYPGKGGSGDGNQTPPSGQPAPFAPPEADYGSDELYATMVEMTNGPSAPPARTAGVQGDRLAPSQYLLRGDYLQSANGACRMELQGDGNLVTRRTADASVTWSTGVLGGMTATMQTDGSFVVGGSGLEGAPSVVWFDPYRRGFVAGTVAVLQDDCNFVGVAPDGQVTFASSYNLEGKAAEAPTRTVGLQGDRLNPGQYLLRGDYLQSANGQCRMYLQDGDGNLVTRRVSDGSAIWAANAYGGTSATMQTDGSFVVETGKFEKTPSLVWSDPYRRGFIAGTVAILQDDCNFVGTAPGGQITFASNINQEGKTSGGGGFLGLGGLLGALLGVFASIAAGPVSLLSVSAVIVP